MVVYFLEYLKKEFRINDRQGEMATYLLRGWITLKEMAAQFDETHDNVRRRAQELYHRCGVESRTEFMSLYIWYLEWRMKNESNNNPTDPSAIYDVSS